MKSISRHRLFQPSGIEITKRQSQSESQKEPKVKPFLMEASAESEFEAILPLLSESEHNLIDGVNKIVNFLKLLNEFFKLIKDYYNFKTNEVLREIVITLKYVKFQKNEVLELMGEQSTKFYIILNGKINVLLLKEKKKNIFYVDYLRYLGYLIGYGEFETLCRTLNSNSGIFPIEILELGNYGRILPTSRKSNIATKRITIKDIHDSLSKEEQEIFKEKFSFAQNHNFSSYSGENSRKNSLNIPIRPSITTEEYIARIKNFDRISKGYRFIREPNEKPLNLNINEYYIAYQIKTGAFFCDNYFNESLNRANCTLITTKETHLALFFKETLPSNLKAVKDFNNNQHTKALLSYKIFRTLTLNYFYRKYYIHFFKKNLDKNTFLYHQNEKIKTIYFIEKGKYEVFCLKTLDEISKYIFYLYSILPKKEIELVDKVNEIMQEHQKIENRSSEITKLKEFYFYSKAQINVFTNSSPEICGLKDSFIDSNGASMFNIVLKTEKNFLYGLDKDVYQMMCETNSSIIENENQYISTKISLMINRLYSIRKNKIAMFFENNPDYIYFPEYIKGIDKIDINEKILKIKPSMNSEKRRKCLSATINRVGKIKNRNDFITDSAFTCKNEKYNTTKKLKKSNSSFIGTNISNIKNSLKNERPMKLLLKKNIHKLRPKTPSFSVTSKNNLFRNKHQSNHSQRSLKNQSTQKSSIFSFENAPNKDLQVSDFVKSNIEYMDYIENKKDKKSKQKTKMDNINELIVHNCPITSIVAKKSLEKRKYKSLVNIFSYQNYKTMRYFESRRIYFNNLKERKGKFQLKKNNNI